MADYSKVVAWSGKDALADSDAAKVISGADFHTEFSAVETAVNTKADINGDAAEAFSATTASTGANTTQVATTAFVQTALQAIYPVGSIYMNAAVSTNPATLLGFGTWAAYAEGKVPVGKASSGTFDTLNATGGAETDSHTLTLSEIPSHNHSDGSYDRLLLQNGQTTVEAVDSSAGEPNLGSSGVIQAAGGGAAHTHDILQPYIVVYMWKRTA
jgi:hypothetical protein